MLNLAVHASAIHIAAVAHLTILKLEVVAVDDGVAALFEDLKKGGLILDVSIGGELAKSEEVLAVDAMVALGLQSCLLYTSPSPRDRQKSRMPSSA